MTGLPAANIETKARCDDLAELERRLAEAGARFEGRLDQTDTYFAVAGMRLKLRQYIHHLPDGRAASGAELIRYERADVTGARVSEYVRGPVEDAAACCTELAARHGIRGIVRKRRELWIAGSTRIHLDRVEGLGEFVELETVTQGEVRDSDRSEHEQVLSLLGLSPADTIAGSYVDLASARLTRGMTSSAISSSERRASRGSAQSMPQ